MILYVNIDDENRIIAIADEGFHLGPDEKAAMFADELGGHVEIYDDRRIPKYKLVDGEAVERASEEMDADYIPPQTTDEATTEERLTAIENALSALQEGIDNV